MIYLDNAATSHPKPEQVYAKMDRFAREVGANPGRAGHKMAVEAEGSIADTRRKLATLFGGSDPSRLIFTLNATDALNMAFKGLLNKGDHVITTEMEHNSVSRPLNRMESEGFIRLTRVPAGRDGAVDPGDIDRAIAVDTRLVAIAHAGNVLGNVQPVREIADLVRKKERLFAVDAAQSAGLLPIDVRGDQIDLLAFTGHKSLLGPAGTGGLYVGERVTLRGWREGGTGGDSADPMQPADYPHRLEAGTPNTLGIAGLGEGVEYVTRRGLEALAGHETGLSLRLWESLEHDARFILYGVKPSAGQPRTGVVSLNLEGHPSSEVGAILDASFGIAVRTGLHCAPGTHRALGTFPDGTVRVSPGPFSTQEEIDQLSAALKEIAS